MGTSENNANIVDRSSWPCFEVHSSPEFRLLRVSRCFWIVFTEVWLPLNTVTSRYLVQCSVEQRVDLCWLLHFDISRGHQVISQTLIVFLVHYYTILRCHMISMWQDVLKLINVPLFPVEFFFQMSAFFWCPFSDTIRPSVRVDPSIVLSSVWLSVFLSICLFYFFMCDYEAVVSRSYLKSEWCMWQCGFFEQINTEVTTGHTQSSLTSFRFTQVKILYYSLVFT